MISRDCAAQALTDYFNGVIDHDNWLKEQPIRTLEAMGGKGITLKGARDQRLRLYWRHVIDIRPDLALKLMALAHRHNHPQHEWITSNELRGPRQLAVWMNGLEKIGMTHVPAEKFGFQFLANLKHYMLYASEDLRNEEQVPGVWIARHLSLMEQIAPGQGLPKQWAEHGVSWLVDMWIQSPLENDPWQLILDRLVEAGADLHAALPAIGKSGKAFANRLHQQLWFDATAGREVASDLALYMLQRGVDLDGAWNDPEFGPDIRQLLPGVRRDRLNQVARSRPEAGTSKRKF